jgi:hypothetical protein
MTRRGGGRRLFLPVGFDDQFSVCSRLLLAFYFVQQLRACSDEQLEA